MRVVLEKRRRLIAGLAAVFLHLLLLLLLIPSGTAVVVEPDSFPQTIDLWLGPNPGGTNQAVASAPQSAVMQSRAETSKLPIETRKPSPHPHPDPIPPKAEPEKASSTAVSPPAPPTPPAPPSLVAGSANWSGRGRGLGDGRGMGRNIGGGGVGGAGEDRGEGARYYVWARELTAEERQTVYPAAGRYASGGLVLLSCVLRGEDRLGGCLILHEQPSGVGFGSAAIVASRLRGVRPLNPDDRPEAGERVRIEMRFLRGGRGDGQSAN